MEFENSLTYLFMQIATNYRNYLQKLLNEIGLNSGQIYVLVSLWKNDGQTQTDLAKSLNLALPTINKMVKSLASNGFVEAQKCGKDSRMVRVYLTVKGREIRASVEERRLKTESNFFSNLSDTERLMFSHLFEKLKENIRGKVAPAATGL